MSDYYTYNPTHWQNDITLLNAENMNNIEQGIVNLFLRPTIPDPRSITSEDQFSFDMIFKYLSYPKYQHTISGGIDDSFYDTLIEPGFHQIGTLSGIREVVFVTAPPGMGGYGSGHSNDSEAYRFQLSFQHERVRYRSCWATSTVESPEPGDWTEWKDLNIPNNMNFGSEEDLEAELNTYIGHHSIRFASVGGYPYQYIIFTKRTGSEEFPKATYQVKLQINYNSAFHMYGRLYNSTDETWGEWNELTKPKDFFSWGYISTVKQIRDNSPQENKVYYFTKTTEEGNIPAGNYYCIRGFKDNLINIIPTVNTGIWYSLTPTGTDTAVVNYTAKQEYDASDPTPISGQGVAQALSNISASGLSPGSINNENLFSLDMMFKYLSYPKVQLSVSGENPYDNIVDPGVYQVGGYGIPFEVLIVMAPQAGIGSGSTSDSDAYRYQVKMGDQNIEYRSSDDLENGWSEWVQLNINVDQTYQFDSPNPQSGKAIAEALQGFKSNLDKIDSEDDFSLDMQEKYLAYPKKQYSLGGENTYDTLIDPGFYQVGGYGITPHFVIVLAPQAGVGSGSTADSDAYRYQIRLSHENIEYRSCWATSTVESPEPGDWTEWHLLNSNTNVYLYSEKTNIGSESELWNTIFPDRATLDSTYFNDEDELNSNISSYLSYMYKLHFYSDDANEWVTNVRNIVGSGMLIGWIRYMASGGKYLYLLSLDGGIKAGNIFKWQITYNGLHIENLTAIHEVDQTYKDTSTNPQSGTAVAQAIASAIINSGSLPLYQKKYDTGYSDTEFNTYTNPGIYQVDTFTGKHEVVMVLSPDSEAYRMQLWFKYNDILYRGIWCTTDGVFADDDWEPWVSLTSGSSNVASDFIYAGQFNSITLLCDYGFKENVKYLFKTGAELAGELTGNICEAYIEPYDGKLIVTTPDNHTQYYAVDLVNKTITYKSLIDDSLSATSTRPVQNKVLNQALNTIEAKLSKLDGVNYFTLSNNMDGDIDDMLNEYIGDNFIGFISPLNNSSYIFINHYNPNDNSNYQRKLYTDSVRSRRHNNLNEWTEWVTVSDYIVDEGEYFKSEDVEGALQEIGETLNGLEDFLASI